MYTAYTSISSVKLCLGLQVTKLYGSNCSRNVKIKMCGVNTSVVYL